MGARRPRESRACDECLGDWSELQKKVMHVEDGIRYEGVVCVRGCVCACVETVRVGKSEQHDG
jgi:hypothetical protein